MPFSLYVRAMPQTKLLASLVVIELAVAAALLTASITTTQYFRKLVDEPWGFATDDRLAFKTMLSERLTGPMLPRQ